MDDEMSWDNACKPLGLNRRAKSYLDAAIFLGADSKLSFSMPRYYLTSHSIELSLKAFLMTQGLSLQKLKDKFGHDLEKLYLKTKEFDFDRQLQTLGADIEIFEAAIRIINKYYTSKELE